MRAAFAVWNDRIAPVFDVSGHLYLVEAEHGSTVHESREKMPCGEPAGKATRLSELKVEVLVCGAISRPLQVMVEAYGIKVIPFITGDLHEIVRAFLSGSIEDGLFAMPGCWRTGQRRFQGICGRMDKEGQMKGQMKVINSGGKGSSNRGQGQGGCAGRRSRRMGGLNAAGPAGTCVCPKCGHNEPHKLGFPCFKQECSKCGSAMVRG
jgi:predicted Fe-Mo cluster-binding NifX family protein